MNKGAVIVTGGAAGIGEATVRRLSRMGYAVGLIDVDVALGEALVAELGQGGRLASFERADVGRPEEGAAAVARLAGRLGPLAGLVNNAGTTIVRALVDTDPEEWRKVLATNLESMFIITRAAAAHLMRPGGSVVNVASFHAQATIPMYTAYASSKAGVIGFTHSLALEWAPDIRVNAVCPGIIDTPMWHRYVDNAPDPAQATAETNRFEPLGRVGTADEVAAPIAFLISPDASYITGTAVYVDGGMTAKLPHI